MGSSTLPINTMKYILITLFSTTFAATCEWLGGSYGQDVDCLPGWVATGMCTSGRKAGCKPTRGGSKYFYALNCCQTKYTNDLAHDCIRQPADAGIESSCPASDDGSTITAVFGGCGSGMNKDCKVNDTKTGNNLNCCQDGDITVGPVSQCGWRYGAAGELVNCPSNYVIAGTCGSGKSAACTSGGAAAFSGIYCCPFVNNNKPK